LFAYLLYILAMNTRALLWAGFVTVFLVLCTQTTFPTTVFALLVMGMIPGTDITIPAWVILATYPMVFLLTIYWLGRQSFFIGEQTTAVPPATKPAKKRQTGKVKSHARRKSTAAKRRPRVAT
jgi:hypothetical protein